MFLSASKEFRLGRRASQRVAVFGVGGLGGGCLKYMLCFSCVVFLTSSKEFRFGHRASECIVVFKV